MMKATANRIRMKSLPQQIFSSFLPHVFPSLSLQITPAFHPGRFSGLYTPGPRRRICFLRCSAKNPKSPTSPAFQLGDVLLKLAWYGSELLGIAASSFRTKPQPGMGELDVGSDDDLEVIDRVLVAETIKKDFERSYFVTGNLTLQVYENTCEFADPAGSFRGLHRFKRNCTNFGSLLEKSDMKLTKWEDFEDKGIAHWRFSCVMAFPWRPILSATGYTEYYFDAQSGRICRHVEHWNVPKTALLKQIFTPGRRAWWRKTDP